MESILIHHGILGQKWGVRRFQNKDGSLTAAGRKRLDRAVNGKKKLFESTSNRDAAGNEYQRKFNSELRIANGGKEFTGDGTEATDLIGERRAARIWNDYIYKFGSATIHDVGLIETKAAKDYVDRLLDKKKIYRYDMIDGAGKKWDLYESRKEIKESPFYKNFKIENERTLEPTLQEKKYAVKQTEKYEKLRKDVNNIEERIVGKQDYSSESEKKRLLNEAGRKSKQAADIYADLRRKDLL